jgi:lysine 6-dehydrogenase
MQILILGSGLMGPASAFRAMCQPDVSHVMLCDMQPAQLARAREQLADKQGSEKLETAVLDMNDQAEAGRLMAAYDVILSAVPRSAVGLAMQASAAAGKPIVDLNWPPDAHLPATRQAVEAAGILAVPGCGLEPGLTEIMARYLAEKMDRVDELHIKCGGIPEKPEPPLGYKIVFGGRQMPLHDWDGCWVENGELKPVARYSGAEPITVPGVGECEAWHEGLMPWLLELEPLKALKVGTQKTIRWPGFGAKVGVLKELGLLSEDPIEVDGVRVSPKRVIDEVLYPQVRLRPGERDISVLRVEVSGEQDGFARSYRIDMVDRFDEATGFSSMARTTGFTAAIVACMIGRGDVQASGWLSPEKIITGPLFSRLVRELRMWGIEFNMTTQLAERL